MADLGELYQALILDHNRSPRNFRAMEGADGHAEGFNPLCGDRIAVWVKLDGDRVIDVAFQGEGCAISKASASLMTAAVKNKTTGEVGHLFESFHALVTGGGNEASTAELGKLVAFKGVAEFPIRVKCASLGWHALRAALDRKENAVSTE